MEDISITNVTMRDIVNAPIFIRLGARLRGPEGTQVGGASRIRITSITAYNVSADSGILISGLADKPIEYLTLSDILIPSVPWTPTYGACWRPTTALFATLTTRWADC
jgi:hypothetical protein